MTERGVENVMRRRMIAWPLYRTDFVLFAIALENDGWSLGYSAPRPRRPFGTYWDANIIKDVFYLLHIQIDKKLRGKGHGAQLYEIIERIAQELKCRRIVQHPSGATINGETRRQYLNRRGWRDFGVEVYKDFPPDPPQRTAVN